MEIRDVIENLRGDVLSLKLRMESLRTQQDAIERFTWNMLTLLRNHDGDIIITLEEGCNHGDPSLDDPALF